MRIFISTETMSDARVVRIFAGLRQQPGVEVDHSQLNPLDGADARWEGWYERGCREAVGAADCFLAIQTKGYDSSTWMAVEFDAAWKLFRERGRPKLLLSKASADKLPVGFRNYEQASVLLPVEPDAVVAEILKCWR